VLAFDPAQKPRDQSAEQLAGRVLAVIEGGRHALSEREDFLKPLVSAEALRNQALSAQLIEKRL
jgi:hypothetical protein